MKFIRSIGNCRLNGHGVDLYENNKGGAVMVHDRYTRRSDVRIFFSSVEKAEQYLETLDAVNGAEKLNLVLKDMEVF